MCHRCKSSFSKDRHSKTTTLTATQKTFWASWPSTMWYAKISCSSRCTTSSNKWRKTLSTSITYLNTAGSLKNKLMKPTNARKNFWWKSGSRLDFGKDSTKLALRNSNTTCICYSFSTLGCSTTFTQQTISSSKRSWNKISLLCRYSDMSLTALRPKRLWSRTFTEIQLSRSSLCHTKPIASSVIMLTLCLSNSHKGNTKLIGGLSTNASNTWNRGWWTFTCALSGISFAASTI